MTEGGNRLARKWLTPRTRRAFGRVGHFLTLPERRQLLIFVVVLALTIFADVFDSFGMDDAGDRAWAGFIDGVQGPFYDRMSGRWGQDHIVVVLLDQQTLQDNGQDGLPLNYMAQADILRRVADAGPRAIFWDSYYPRERTMSSVAMHFGGHFGMQMAEDPGVAALAGTMTSIGRRLPLLIGPVSPDNAVLAPLAKLVSDDARLPSGRGVREVSIEVDPREMREYPLSNARDQQDKPAGEGDPVLPSAAVALYSAYCAVEPDAKCQASPQGEKMILQWGFGVSAWRIPLLPKERRASCGGGRSGFATFIGYLLRGVFRALQKDAADDRLLGQRCGYHDVVPMRAFNDLDAAGQPLSKHLAGKIVLIGFDLPSSGDRRTVPFYGDVPGVLTHAMALDNLIKSHGRPAQAPEKKFLGIDELDIVQYFFMIIFIAGAFLLSGKTRRIFLLRDTAETRENISRGFGLLVLLTLWALIAFYGVCRGWPLASIILGGFLPGSVLAVAVLFLARAGAAKPGGR